MDFSVFFRVFFRHSYSQSINAICIVFCWSDYVFIFISFLSLSFPFHLFAVFTSRSMHSNIFKSMFFHIECWSKLQSKDKMWIEQKQIDIALSELAHCYSIRNIVKNGCILIRFAREFCLRTFNLDFIFHTISNFSALTVSFGFILYLSVCVFVGLATLLSLSRRVCVSFPFGNVLSHYSDMHILPL